MDDSGVGGLAGVRNLLEVENGKAREAEAKKQRWATVSGKVI